MRYFPVFINLGGQPVLIVGGGRVAARKARLLIAAGARVSVIAAELGHDMARWHGRGDIDWLGTDFDPCLIERFWLAFAATDDQALNRAVFEAGEAARVPVNAVDDAPRCRFISPAVVDRDPVQVAISTGGSAPLLARRIRGWIEQLLPRGLGRVARAAGSLRAEVKRRLPPERRRRFWESVLDRGSVVHWSTRPVEAIARDLRARLGREPAGAASGKVYLVGAGPGRPELLTLRALEVLQQADVILHDRLVPAAILDQARRDADRVDVGKRAGRHHGVQQRIFARMVDEARRGKTVVRLKGGDAFVFGRGGEELEFLKAQGIEYEVVPGITAALGCAAYAGIPLTHREHAQVLTLITGHLAGQGYGGEEAGGAFDGRWLPEVGGEGRTLAVYMGVKQAPRIRESLLRAGYQDYTPAALIVDGTMDGQRVIHGSLATLPGMAKQAGAGHPGLFIIGKVAALGRELAWFEGARVLDAAA